MRVVVLQVIALVSAGPLLAQSSRLDAEDARDGLLTADR